MERHVLRILIVKASFIQVRLSFLHLILILHHRLLQLRLYGDLNLAVTMVDLLRVIILFRVALSALRTSSINQFFKIFTQRLVTSKLLVGIVDVLSVEVEHIVRGQSTHLV